jgi:hypothetical protein
MTADDVEWVPWVCPACGKGGPDHPSDKGPIKARARTIIRCVCGHLSWSS